MASDYARAVRGGTMAAGRLHRQLGDRALICSEGANVDVFGAILALDLPIVLRPLEGLLGAYLREPAPGVLRMRREHHFSSGIVSPIWRARL
jgi:hypothetical protein